MAKPNGISALPRIEAASLMVEFKGYGDLMSDGIKDVKQQDSLTTAEENRSMFDAIAGYYDGTNKILSFGLDGVWRSRAVTRLQPVPGGKYLDVGCGTGDIALEIVRQSREARLSV